MKAYLLDDEPLAVERLERLLAAHPGIEIVGRSNDPLAAAEEIDALAPDLLFLDIQMPELDGFQLLARLVHQPLVIFTTAFDQYALQAFEANSIAYLLKPVGAAKLAAAILKIEAIRGGGAARPDLTHLLGALNTRLAPAYPERISSRIGERTELIDLSRVTHFYAEDKLTFAATEAKDYIVDQTISELEERLDPARFCRIHRSTLVNLAYVTELYTYFGGKLIVKLKGARKAELTVAKERARELRTRLAL